MKSGYKQTEIGVIPEDWDIGSLKEAFPRLNAGVSVNSDERAVSDYYVLKTSAVRNGKVNIREAKPVVVSDYPRLKCPVKKGSIIISRMNTPAMVGECGYSATDATDTFLPDRLWQGEPSSPDYDFQWLNYLLNTEKYSAAIRATATGTSNSMKNIAKDRLLEIAVPKPPRPEQERIAVALSDMDEMITWLEKLIAKKKAIKQGTMQELLTGKRRLPGFTGKWITVSIGECGSLSKESINPLIYPSEYFWEYSMPAFDEGKSPTKQLGGNMHSNRIRITGSVLLFNKLNVRQKRIWLVNHCPRNSVCSSEFLPYCSNALDLRLLKYILETDKTTSDFVGMSTGTSNSQKRITPDAFLEYTVYIPKEIDEQYAIADNLESIEKECTTLVRKRNKAYQIKQGMMQQLLTGKKRL